MKYLINIRTLILILFTAFITPGILTAKTFKLNSPADKISVDINVADKVYYSVNAGDKELLSNNYMRMETRHAALGDNPKLISHKYSASKGEFEPVVPFKFSKIEYEYNSLRMNFKGGYSIEFRAYDEGIAYRFITSFKDETEILNEDFAINFPADYSLTMQQPGGFKTAYEEPYSIVSADDWKASDKMAVLPLLIDTKQQYKILISEADLSDYPCMFLTGNGQNGIRSVFPKAPLEFGEDGDRSLRILKEADYIAKTTGTRNYPWRYFVIVDEDGRLLENTMTAKLSSQSEIKDPSWIKPGQVSWEWWNGATPYGPDVDFVSGFNMDTYKYFIDFAAKYEIPYIIMDEGWAMSTLDPYTPNPTVDVHEIIRYGEEKNVGVVLWLTWLVVENHFEVFEKLSEWGAAGVKIDFMDRSDQWMVNYYERVAKEAAKHKLFVSFHGSFKPAGLEYKYPNVLAYEGVLGMEQMGRCRPSNSIWLPFMRNAVGPMDYTPGAMFSMQPEAYRAERPNSGSIGTRAYQMALFTIFETGLQMLADNPTLYYREHECTEFITSVPVTWDETKALDAEAGKYVAVAKQKGDKWFIGAINGDNNNSKELELSLDFLENGKYTITWFEDGINADRQAMDYRKRSSTVEQNDKLSVKMVRNGGWTAVIEPN